MRAAKFAMDNQIQYHEVSSKLNENVTKSFENLIK